MTDIDTAFTANGEDSPGKTQVAFETKLDGNIEIGVGVVGTQCGVFGQDREYQQTFSTTTRDGDAAGVVGYGIPYGVVGKSLKLGVFGKVAPPDSGGMMTKDQAAGVLGEGFDNSYGVVGLCFRGASEEDPTFGSSIGVLGVSNAKSDRTSSPDPPDPRTLGAGVVGISVTKNIKGLDDNPNPIPQITDDVNTFGDGTGVWGVSRGGRGVHGQSDSGRGGVFESTTSSQLQLVPVERPPGLQRRTLPTSTNSAFPELPRDGQAGDLIATLEQESDNGDPSGSSSQARLWFCVRSVVVDPNTKKTNRVAGWAQVLLGDTFDGG